jgi:aarF domain-containing kinase
LGQVHGAVLKDGRKVALKIQYPGVAESIESDVANLRRIVRLTGIFPRGLFIDRILDVVGAELGEECDYEKEAAHQTEFARLFKHDKAFKIPYVVPELSTKRVLTMEFVSGLPLDKVVDLPQAARDRVGRMLLRLTLRELFEFGYVQSDPNFANYFYDPSTGQLCLLDFGATKKYDDQFVDDYAVLVWAAAENDRDTLLRKSIELGLLNGKESEAMMNAHVESAFEIAEPFSRRTRNLSYDFANSDVSARIAHHGPTFLRDRLIPPPQEIYSLHRKLSGAFMACVRIKARFPCRDLLEHAVKRRIKEAEQRKKLSEPKL